MRGIIAIGSFLALIVVMVSCQSEQELEFARYYSAGATVYQAHCQNCHGDKGQGLAALIPPLTDAGYLIKNKDQMACSLKIGMKGAVIISNKTFDSQMPAADLTPMETAQVLTYVTNSFGNKMGLITIDQVNKDLKGCQ